jgi:type IV pilus assembly protein PilY1
MKNIKTIFLGLMIFSMLFAVLPFCYALDTDLYVLSGANIPPNVLIILDNSASMEDVIAGQIYDPAIDYSAYSPATIYPGNAVYIKSGNNWVNYADDITTVCADLKDNYLIPFGEAINYSNVGCNINKKDFQTGNFRNYLQLSGGPGGSRPRFGLALGIIHSYVNTVNGVRFAVMAFNNDSSGKTVKYNSGSKQEYVDPPMTGNEDAIGGTLLGFVDENKNGKTALFQNLSSLKNETWSPLAETLSIGATYFQNGQIPVQYTCQKNYVLIISDGDPTKDTGNLADIATSLFNLDLNGEILISKQNIKTYSIGFSMTHALLESTARNGGGKYFHVFSSQSFNIAFQTFIAEVLQENTSYVAPVVPISQMEKTSAGNRMYLAMFKPTEKGFWKGNIKKYGIATKNDGSIVFQNENGEFEPVPDQINTKVGDILDAEGNLIMDSENKIKDSARSYWTKKADGPDGEDVEKGGIGKILQDRVTARKLYTYLGSEADLTDSSNAFDLSNNAITPATLGLAADDITGMERVFNFVNGLDAYDWEGLTGVPDGITNVKRSWIQGAFIHSRPLVIHYRDRSVIFVGSNGGMLQAFDDATGEELWGFIPRNLLPNLKNFNGEELQLFVDGAPKIYMVKDINGDLTTGILLFGFRRGGNRYIALDIRDPLKPQFLYEISPSTTGFGEMGQTWSTPLIGKIKLTTGDKVGAFIGAGYDQNQDNEPVSANDTKGRGVYVFDVLNNGSLIWSYTYAKNDKMKFCIPSDISRVDTNGNGYIDRLYVGDMGGQMWRFDINDPDSTKWTGKIVFDSNPGLSQKRKIFYPPDVTLETGNYEMLFFGTGDREHPKNLMFENRIYAIKDTNSSLIVENDLVDVTDVMATLNALNAKSGWFIHLENSGEKSLSHSVVFDGVVYYTTFTPTFGELGDPCALKEGSGRLYALKYKSGSAAFNLDDSTDGVISQQTDQSEIIGPSIPSGVIITFIGGTTTAYAGVGGGVYRPPLKNNKTIIPIHWKIVTK